MTQNLFLLMFVLSVCLSGCTKKNPTGPGDDTPPDSLTVLIPGMVHVDGAAFTMGSVLANVNEKPVHTVMMSSFSMDKSEITFEKWTEVREWGLSHGYADLPAGRNGYKPASANNPVTELNWYDVVKWCNARSEKNSFTPVYYLSGEFSAVYRTGELVIGTDAVNWEANGYRLPTEAEWEFAARGGMKPNNYLYSGGPVAADVAWYDNNSGNITHHVGTKKANGLGLFDMSGNAAEWCWDIYGLYPNGIQIDPRGVAIGSYRVLRGGSFDTNEFSSRVSYRNFTYPAYRFNNLGFRCVQK